jgi:protein-disulfide isomerase
LSTPDASRRNRLLVPVIVAVSFALITAVLVVMPQQGNDGKHRATTAAAPTNTNETSGPSEEAEGESTPLARRQPNDPMAMGKPDAPVVMVSYSEFQCPFCGKFARDTEPTLIKDYVDKGILRIEWRDFPYLGEESLTAARAGRAAGAQGRFWEFHDAMYAAQLPPNSGRLTGSHVTSIAEKIGLDVERFATDLDSDELTGAIQRDFQEGQAIGVTGTPAFIINGKPVIGAQPTAEFVKVIEQAAKSAS